MNHATWTAVDTYLEALVPQDDVLVAANAAAESAGLPPIQVSATQGRLLQLLTQMCGARRVLEVGTLAGYSTICLARGLPAGADGGVEPHLTTLEIDPVHAAVARSNLERAGLLGVVEVRVGPAEQSLVDLVAQGVPPFDLVFLDADKPSNVRYLELSLDLTGPGAVIIVDNVVRDGTVAEADSTDERVRGSRAVIDRVAADPRLTGTVIQTVGTKGYDGFMLVRVGP